MNMILRCALLATVACLSFPRFMAASDYPGRPITMIIPFSPGGGGDIAVRLIEKEFQKEFGQPLSFVYKPGADGAIGYSEMATLKADGYTLGAVSYPHLLMNKMKGAGFYDMDSFDLLCMPVRDDVFLVTARDGGAKSLNEFIESAKANPNKLTVGTVDALISSHIPALQLKKAGVPYTITTFNGGPKALPALLGGHIHALFATKGTAMGSAGTLNILAVASDQRDPTMPDVPTFKELGYDIVGMIGRGFFAPKGLPADVRQRLEDGFRNIYSQPGIAEHYSPRGMTVKWVDGKEFEQMFRDFQPDAEAAMKLNKELSGQ